MIDFPVRDPPTTTNRALGVSDCPRDQGGHGRALRSAAASYVRKRGLRTRENLVVQFGVGSRPGSCTGFGRSVGRFGLVSGLGSGRLCADVVLVHLFGFFAVSGGAAFGFVFAPGADLKISEEKGYY